MTPKEKAKELVDKFTVVGLQQRNEGYQCALIAVDELIKWMPGKEYHFDETSAFCVEYWELVKQEIEKL